jgi:hypothetical protein
MRMKPEERLKAAKASFRRGLTAHSWLVLMCMAEDAVL